MYCADRRKSFGSYSRRMYEAMRRRKTRGSVYQGPFLISGMQVWIISAVILITLIITAWNAVGLQKVLARSTKEYLKDVTTHMAGEIGNTMHHKSQDLAMTADFAVSSLSGTEEDEAGLVQFLEQEARLLEFNVLTVIDRQGEMIHTPLPDTIDETGLREIAKLDCVRESFDGKAGTSYLGGQEIIYSVPVYVDMSVEYVMVGTRSKEKMQDMIASKSFDGNSLSCIIDSSGEVILSPTDLKPFLQLDDIFKENKDEKLLSEIGQMRRNMQKGKGGILEFTSPLQEELFLSYDVLGINDWVLLTIIPADLISGNSEGSIWRFFLILIFVMAVFLIFLVNVYRFFNTGRRELERYAFEDSVTGGMNQAAFCLKYEELAGKMEPSAYSIVMMNVKGFKMINERFGTEAGNTTLRYIHHVLQCHIRPSENEFVSRNESDSFFLCLRDAEPESIRTRLKDMAEEINSSSQEGVPRYPIVFRQGACVIRDPGEEITILQDHARLAEQSGEKEAGGDCVFYDEKIVKRLKWEEEMNALFEESLRCHEFQVYLQPKVSPKSGEAVGAEALVRWQHSEKGVIFPSDFIPLFEKNGKICRLDMYIFEEVCALMAKWENMGRRQIPVSVNLSRQHFRKPDFLSEFSAIAERCKVRKELLEFELTESIFLDEEQIDVVKDSIRRMHELGFRCSLDDFGSGFSSLGLLKEFDVDALKLDRLFFLDMHSEKARDVIACLMELAKKLNVETVAEGIEEPEQVEYLRRVNCDMIQGYVYSKPIPADEFEEKYMC